MFKKLLACILAILIISSVFAFTACTDNNKNNSEAEYYEYTFVSMDTFITVRLSYRSEKTDEEGNVQRLDTDYLKNAAKECENICANVDAVFSRTVDTSSVSQLNADIDMLVGADEEFVELLKISIRIAELTDGAFDPTVGVLSELWNVTGGGPVPDAEEINDALAHVGYDSIQIKNDGTVVKSDSLAKVDMGGIGKGYAAQKMLEYLNDSDICYGIISVGGNVGVFGEKPDGTEFKIGICDPNNTSDIVGYMYTLGGFVSVSGDYERYFEEDGKRYHHIFDASTGYPAETDIRSVAVISNSGASADALSTALFVMGVESAMEFYANGDVSFEAVFVMNDGTVRVTDGLKENRLFDLTSENYTLGTSDEASAD